MAASDNLHEQMVCTTCELPFPFTEDYFPRRATGKLETRCRECRNTISKARYLKRKIAALTHYCGGKEPHCQCCGETTLEFLTIDHINGGGAKHRAELKGKIVYLFQWLEREGFPDGYRVLCMNCNLANGLFGACPHQVGPIQAKVFDRFSRLTLRAPGDRRTR